MKSSALYLCQLVVSVGSDRGSYTESAIEVPR